MANDTPPAGPWDLWPEQPVDFGQLVDLSNPTPSIEVAKSALANVRQLSLDRIDSCIEQCRGPAEECQACITGSIDNRIGVATAAVDKVSGAVGDHVDQFVRRALDQAIIASGEVTAGQTAATTSSPDVWTVPDSGRGGTIPIGPPGPGGGNSIPFSTITIGGGGSIPLGPPAGGGILLGGGNDTIPPSPPPPPPPPGPPPPPPPPAECSPYDPPTDAGCTFGSCIDTAYAAGGRVLWSDRYNTWTVINPDGSLQFCTAVDMPARCFADYAGVAQFVLNNAQYGWEIRYHDETDQNTAYAFNPIYQMLIEGNNSCQLITPARGPCPRPSFAPPDAVLVPRDDGKAAWVDRNGTVYGDVCDLGDCTISTDAYGSYVGYFSSIIWIDFPDDVSGWLSPNGGFQACTRSDATVPLTYEDASQWIDQQPDPDNWDMVYDEDSQQFLMENQETGQQQFIADQPPPDAVDEDVPPPDDGGVLALDLVLPDDELLFAERN